MPCKHTALNIGIYIYPGAEVLDFSGPFEVFSTANRLSVNGELFRVSLIAESRQALSARAGYSLNPHYSIHNHPQLDVLLVVGGVHDPELNKPAVLAWVKRIAEQASIVASVCTGVFILAEAGVLSGIEVTTHWEDIPALRHAYPKLTVLENQRWVEQGKYITSAGISAGIDMSLHLVAKLADTALAEKTARQMEFDWTKNK